MPKTIDVSGKHGSIRIGPEIGSGGAGKIYLITGDPDRVAKIYRPEHLKLELRHKLEAMLRSPPELPSIVYNGKAYAQIAWPERLIIHKKGDLSGMVMPRVPLDRAEHLEALLQPASRVFKKLPHSYRLRLLAAHNLAAAIESLHKLNHHMVDMKPTNLFVYPETMYVAVIDCDGLSVSGKNGKRFPASQYSNDYICPECGSDPPESLGVEQDRFALAIIIFQLMNEGIHPYQGRPISGLSTPSSLQERINGGFYAYGLHGKPPQLPSPLSLHEAFEEETRRLFDRAFSLKARNRPSADEWRRHIKGLIERLKTCNINPDHGHFSKGCGACSVEANRRAPFRQIPAVPPLSLKVWPAATPPSPVRSTRTASPPRSPAAQKAQAALGQPAATPGGAMTSPRPSPSSPAEPVSWIFKVAAVAGMLVISSFLWQQGGTRDQTDRTAPSATTPANPSALPVKPAPLPAAVTLVPPSPQPQQLVISPDDLGKPRPKNPPKWRITTMDRMTMDGIGPLKIGMDVRTVREVLGQEFVLYQPSTSERPCGHADLRSGPRGIDFTIAGDLITRIEIINPDFKTLEGAAVGSSSAFVHFLYAGEIATEAAADMGAQLIVIGSKSEMLPGNEIVFEMKDDLVQKIRIGRWPQVESVGDCD